MITLLASSKLSRRRHLLHCTWHWNRFGHGLIVWNPWHDCIFARRYLHPTSIPVEFFCFSPSIRTFCQVSGKERKWGRLGNSCKVGDAIYPQVWLELCSSFSRRRFFFWNIGRFRRIASHAGQDGHVPEQPSRKNRLVDCSNCSERQNIAGWNDGTRSEVLHISPRRFNARIQRSLATQNTVRRRNCCIPIYNIYI